MSWATRLPSPRWPSTTPSTARGCAATTTTGWIPPGASTCAWKARVRCATGTPSTWPTCTPRAPRWRSSTRAWPTWVMCCCWPMQTASRWTTWATGSAIRRSAPAWWSPPTGPRRADAAGTPRASRGPGVGDPPIRAGLVVGANWHEAHAGTNGIGTCLAECRTLTCHYDDHFYAGNLDLSCTATPLFDPEGELMGALDLSSLTTPDSRASQHLIGHMASMYGRMIEDANFLRHFGHRWVLRLGRAASLVEGNAEGLRAFDPDGVIVGADRGARRLLQTVGGQSGGALLGQPLSAVFRNPLGDVMRLGRAGNGDSSALLHPWLGEPRQAMVRGPQRRTRMSGATSAQADHLQPATQGDVSSLEALSDRDPKMDALISQARRLAGRSINMIIQGETGTGKEVLAQAIHQASSRADRAFVAINCAAIPESLIESDLYGYLPGPFPGARSRGMVGLIQRADGGTLFLDEIGDMPLALQTRLLRVLAERELLPLGADKPIPLALTVLAASHRNLRERISAGQFREDLYCRLSGATLSLPPLRERQDRADPVPRIPCEEATPIRRQRPPPRASNGTAAALSLAWQHPRVAHRAALRPFDG